MDNCADNATCSDTEGSYECTCDPGFSGDGFNCTSKINRVLIIGLCEEQYDNNTNNVVWQSPDVNECALHLDDCDENSDCVDTEGGYDCECHDGFIKNGTICTSNM